MSLFVTFEGIEGCGKSTQVQLLASELAGRDPLVIREPGGTQVGDRVRELVLHSELKMSAEAEMYLYMAARAEIVATRIVPALAEDRIVLADRYHDSTLAYQGAGRGARTFWPEEFPVPDVTFLFALDPELGLARHRGTGRPLDRLEREPLAFHRRVEEAYERLAGAEPARWIRLDADRPVEELRREVLARLEPFLVGEKTGGRTSP